jgi:PKD repeat protein
MKQKAILILALLALISMTIAPVLAWTTITTLTVPSVAGPNGYRDYLYVWNWSAFSNPSDPVTRLYVEGYAYWSALQTDSSSGILKIGLTPVGCWTASWHSNELANYSAAYWIDIQFSNINTGYSGQQNVILFDNYVNWWTAFNTGSGIRGYNGNDTDPTHFDGGQESVYLQSWDYNVASGVQTIYGGSAVVTPVASFTCVPTSQYLNTDVVCTDTSTNTPTSWLWTIDGFGVNGWQTSTTRNFSWQSSYAGTFNVNLQATNGAGSDWENKTNYVTISGTTPGPTPTPYQIIDPIAAGHNRTWFINSDGQTGGSIQGSFIDLYDVQNTSWRNTTLSMSVNGNLAYIDTHPDHTINAYGHAVGYDSDTRMGLPAADTVYELILWSGSIPSPSPGNVNLFVIVSASPSGMALTNAQVTASKPGGGWDAVLTGISGTASFVMPNMSLIYVSASKSGYGTVTSTITTTALGPDTLRITLPKLTVTPTITATPLPGEATARPTYAPGCDPSAYDAAICNTGKDSAMMDQIRDAGPTLIGLAIIATAFGLIKLMTKK